MNFDLEIAARTVWMEARNQGDTGMLAVAHVIVNRHLANKWYSGKTLAECCLVPYQFSCWNTDDKNRIFMTRIEEDDQLLEDCRMALHEALSGAGEDPTHGATHYVNRKVVADPKWVAGATKTAVIGDHTFYKDVE